MKDNTQHINFKLATGPAGSTSEVVVDKTPPVVDWLVHCRDNTTTCTPQNAASSICSSSCLHFAWSAPQDNPAINGGPVVSSVASLALKVTQVSQGSTRSLYSASVLGTRVTLCGLGLASGSLVSASLTATDGAGNSRSQSTSNALLVDGSPPVVPSSGVVNGGAVGRHQAVVMSLVDVAVSFAPFTDKDSPLSNYDVGLVLNTTGALAKAIAVVPDDAFARRGAAISLVSSTSLACGVPYVWRVVGTNSAGCSVVAWSLPFVADNAPPDVSRAVVSAVPAYGSAFEAQGPAVRVVTFEDAGPQAACETMALSSVYAGLEWKNLAVQYTSAPCSALPSLSVGGRAGTTSGNNVGVSSGPVTIQRPSRMLGGTFALTTLSVTALHSSPSLVVTFAALRNGATLGTVDATVSSAAPQTVVLPASTFGRVDQVVITSASALVLDDIVVDLRSLVARGDDRVTSITFATQVVPARGAATCADVVPLQLPNTNLQWTNFLYPACGTGLTPMAAFVDPSPAAVIAIPTASMTGTFGLVSAQLQTVVQAGQPVRPATVVFTGYRGGAVVARDTFLVRDVGLDAALASAFAAVDRVEVSTDVRVAMVDVSVVTKYVVPTSPAVPTGPPLAPTSAPTMLSFDDLLSCPSPGPSPGPSSVIRPYQGLAFGGFQAACLLPSTSPPVALVLGQAPNISIAPGQDGVFKLLTLQALYTSRIKPVRLVLTGLRAGKQLWTRTVDVDTAKVPGVPAQTFIDVTVTSTQGVDTVLFSGAPSDSSLLIDDVVVDTQGLEVGSVRVEFDKSSAAVTCVSGSASARGPLGPTPFPSLGLSWGSWRLEMLCGSTAKPYAVVSDSAVLSLPSGASGTFGVISMQVRILNGISDVSTGLVTRGDVHLTAYLGPMVVQTISYPVTYGKPSVLRLPTSFGAVGRVTVQVGVDVAVDYLELDVGLVKLSTPSSRRLTGHVPTDFPSTGQRTN